jgi:hypothetical protein
VLPPSSSSRLPLLHKLFLDRLRTPHATVDDTFQAYTSLVSRYSESDYEQLLVKASKAKADGVGKWSKRERWEKQLVSASHCSLKEACRTG